MGGGVVVGHGGGGTVVVVVVVVPGSVVVVVVVVVAPGSVVVVVVVVTGTHGRGSIVTGGLVGATVVGGGGATVVVVVVVSGTVVVVVGTSVLVGSGVPAETAPSNRPRGAATSSATNTALAVDEKRECVDIRTVAAETRFTDRPAAPQVIGQVATGVDDGSRERTISADRAWSTAVSRVRAADRRPVPARPPS